MAFTYSTTGGGTSSGSGTTVASSAVALSAHDLVVIYVFTDNQDVTVSGVTDGGSNVATVDTRVRHANGQAATCTYILDAVANASAVFTATVSPACSNRFIKVVVFHGATGTTKDQAQASGTGSTAAMATGAITTTGTDEVVISGTYFGGSTITGMQIGGVNADSPHSTNDDWWFRILASTMSGGTSVGTEDSALDWVLLLNSFKASSASYTPPFNPPKKGEDFQVRIALENFTALGEFKANPTIAAGDFKVDIDGAGFANLSVLPSVSPAGSVAVLVTLPAAEMNGDVITFTAIDQTSPKEWRDFFFSMPTTQ